MFIKENSTVDIVIHYKKIGNHFLSYGEGEFKDEDLTDEERKEYKKITVQMKQLTWGLYNELQEGAVDVDGQGNRQFNYKKYKELRLIKLIAGWDATAKDDEGKDVPVRVTEKSIKCLAPEIAETILNAYDQVMYLTEEEEKK
jgi:hypothetical protein